MTAHRTKMHDPLRDRRGNLRAPRGFSQAGRWYPSAPERNRAVLLDALGLTSQELSDIADGAQALDMLARRSVAEVDQVALLIECVVHRQKRWDHDNPS